MAPTLASELLLRAEVLSKNHEPIPYFSETGLSPRSMIFCCFDWRVKPEEFLGLTAADDTILVRTGSGTPARNIMDIVAIDTLVGLTELIVIKHTDCGATHITNDDIRDHIIKHNPDLAGKLDNFITTATTDLVKRAELDVEIIKSSPLIRKELRETAVGLLYDIKTGKVTRVA
ncbi:carbonic anhydrase [Nemania sp. FL0031]|nr:carbonic anhydrase [Nemania sp. FL0031]